MPDNATPIIAGIYADRARRRKKEEEDYRKAMRMLPDQDAPEPTGFGRSGREMTEPERSVARTTPESPLWSGIETAAGDVGGTLMHAGGAAFGNLMSPITNTATFLARQTSSASPIDKAAGNDPAVKIQSGALHDTYAAIRAPWHAGERGGAALIDMLTGKRGPKSELEKLDAEHQEDPSFAGELLKHAAEPAKAALDPKLDLTPWERAKLGGGALMGGAAAFVTPGSFGSGKAIGNLLKDTEVGKFLNQPIGKAAMQAGREIGGVGRSFKEGVPEQLQRAESRRGQIATGIEGDVVGSAPGERAAGVKPQTINAADLGGYTVDRPQPAENAIGEEALGWSGAKEASPILGAAKRLSLIENDIGMNAQRFNPETQDLQTAFDLSKPMHGEGLSLEARRAVRDLPLDRAGRSIIESIVPKEGEPPNAALLREAARNWLPPEEYAAIEGTGGKTVDEIIQKMSPPAPKPEIAPDLQNSFDKVGKTIRQNEASGKPGAAIGPSQGSTSATLREALKKVDRDYGDPDAPFVESHDVPEGADLSFNPDEWEAPSVTGNKAIDLAVAGPKGRTRAMPRDEGKRLAADLGMSEADLRQNYLQEVKDHDAKLRDEMDLYEAIRKGLGVPPSDARKTEDLAGLGQFIYGKGKDFKGKPPDLVFKENIAPNFGDRFSQDPATGAQEMLDFFARGRPRRKEPLEILQDTHRLLKDAKAYNEPTAPGPINTEAAQGPQALNARTGSPGEVGVEPAGQPLESAPPVPAERPSEPIAQEQNPAAGAPPASQGGSSPPAMERPAAGELPQRPAAPPPADPFQNPANRRPQIDQFETPDAGEPPTTPKPELKPREMPPVDLPQGVRPYNWRGSVGEDLRTSANTTWGKSGRKEGTPVDELFQRLNTADAKSSAWASEGVADLLPTIEKINGPISLIRRWATGSKGNPAAEAEVRSLVPLAGNKNIEVGRFQSSIEDVFRRVVDPKDRILTEPLSNELASKYKMHAIENTGRKAEELQTGISRGGQVEPFQRAKDAAIYLPSYRPDGMEWLSSGTQEANKALDQLIPEWQKTGWQGSRPQAQDLLREAGRSIVKQSNFEVSRSIPFIPARIRADEGSAWHVMANVDPMPNALDPKGAAINSIVNQNRRLAFIEQFGQKDINDPRFLDALSQKHPFRQAVDADTGDPRAVARAIAAYHSDPEAGWLANLDMQSMNSGDSLTDQIRRGLYNAAKSNLTFWQGPKSALQTLQEVPKLAGYQNTGVALIQSVGRAAKRAFGSGEYNEEAASMGLFAQDLRRVIEVRNPARQVESAIRNYNPFDFVGSYMRKAFADFNDDVSMIAGQRYFDQLMLRAENGSLKAKDFENFDTLKIPESMRLQLKVASSSPIPEEAADLMEKTFVKRFVDTTQFRTQNKLFQARFNSSPFLNFVLPFKQYARNNLTILQEEAGQVQKILENWKTIEDPQGRMMEKMKRLAIKLGMHQASGEATGDVSYYLRGKDPFASEEEGGRGDPRSWKRVWNNFSYVGTLGTLHIALDIMGVKPGDWIGSDAKVGPLPSQSRYGQSRPGGLLEQISLPAAMASDAVLGSLELAQGKFKDAGLRGLRYIPGVKNTMDMTGTLPQRDKAGSSRGDSIPKFRMPRMGGS